MHQRSPSFYETQIIFGQSGPYFMLNLLQCCCFLFCVWVEIVFNHYRIEIVNKYNKFSYIFLGIALGLYFIFQLLITSFALKWLTLISSVRNIFIIFRLK
ncbi:MAG: hypothetical protein MJ252_23980 [archaeon]|nr:hypothetical protein [archaeon]